MQTHMRNSKNGTNHEETSCVLDHTVSKLYRIVLWSVIHLCKKLVGILLFFWTGFYQSLDFVAVTVIQTKTTQLTSLVHSEYLDSSSVYYMVSMM